MRKSNLFKQDAQVVLYVLSQQSHGKVNVEGSFNLSMLNIQSLTGFSAGYVRKLLVDLESDHLILLKHPKARVNLCTILTSDLPDREWFEQVTGRSSVISKMQKKATAVSDSELIATQNDTIVGNCESATRSSAIADSFGNSVKCSQGSSYFVRTNNCLSVKSSMQVAKLRTEYKTVRERLAEASK